VLLSDAIQRSDPADLFCLLYDDFPKVWFRNREALAWLQRLDAGLLMSAADELNAGRGDYGTLMHGVAAWDERRQARSRLMALCILDEVLSHAVPGATDRVPAPLTEVARRYAEFGRLSSEHVKGGLVPRFATPTRPTQAAERLAACFHHVVRVPEDTWNESDHGWPVQRMLDLDPQHRANGIAIGIAPLLGRLDELRIEPRELPGTPSYAITTVDTPPLRARIEHVLEVFDESGCELAIVPELSLTRSLLSHWQELMRAHPDRGEALRWVVVGTGPLENERDLPPNRAVVLARRTGDELWTQDKNYGFTLKPEQIRDWGLERTLGCVKRDEHITFGRPRIVESAGGRFSILICEDMGRIMAVGPIAGHHGVSLVISPIFSKEILEHRWEDQAAEPFDLEFGSRVVVVNSLAVARWRLENRCSKVAHGGKPGVLLVRANVPDEEAERGARSHFIGTTTDPEEVIVVRVSSSGVTPLKQIRRTPTGRFVSEEFGLRLVSS
jgi:predicted amidohydrolase